MTVATAASERVNADVITQRTESIAHLFRERVATSGERAAFYHFRGDELERVGWWGARESVYELASGLMELGVNLEDRVAIISTTRYEWVLADLAVMCAGGATTTVYPTSSASDIAYLLADSGSEIVIAEDAAQVEKLRSRRHELPAVRRVVCFDPEVADGDWVISLKQLASSGRARLREDDELVDARIDRITRDHLATIIYTSGTTGRPKGAELTHDALVYEGASVASMNFLTDDDLQYLWLPLSHVFGKVLLAIALQVGCATAVDGRVDKIVDNLAIVQPTWMGAAPRIFEKAKAKISLTLAEEHGLKASLVEWALQVGAAVAADREAGRPVPKLLRAQHAVADRLVLSKIRARFGGKVRFFISGSAALDPDVARWFAAVGLLVIEGYGLTETSAATTVNRPFDGSYRFGSIGWPMPGTTLRIDADGELLVRGPGVMRRYHNQPEATDEVMTQDGFFRTGDIAAIDERGFVRLTDRKKDVFKTSGGKYVAPAQIEAHFKGLCPYVSQFIVVGESRNFASALVTLDPDAIRLWAQGTSLAGCEYAEIVTSAQARDLVQGYVDQLNVSLNRWETIKKFVVLDRDLTIEDGELTPSLKLKRRVVAQRFADKIEQLYT